MNKKVNFKDCTLLDWAIFTCEIAVFGLIGSLGIVAVYATMFIVGGF